MNEGSLLMALRAGFKIIVGFARLTMSWDLMAIASVQHWPL